MNENKIRVDFHILQDKKADKNIYLARLIEKIFFKNLSVLIVTSSQKESQEIDDFLWTYRDTSFLPHHIVGDALEPSPILITNIAVAQQQILIDLTSSLCEFYHCFERIIEIVHGPEELRQMSRAKYKQYQSLACDLNTYPVTQGVQSL